MDVMHNKMNNDDKENKVNELEVMQQVKICYHVELCKKSSINEIHCPKVAPFH